MSVAQELYEEGESNTNSYTPPLSPFASPFLLYLKIPRLFQIHVWSGPTPRHDNKVYRTANWKKYGQLIVVYRGASRLNVDLE